MSIATETALDHFPPMGIYDVLFRFLDHAGVYMGEPGTHPWAQGFPLTTQLPGGPEIPTSVQFSHADLRYPPATGVSDLLVAIRDYYNHFHDAGIETDNIAVFAGGRPGIFAATAFLNPAYEILIEETEYTPYYDLLRLLKRSHTLVPSNPDNEFRPTVDDYRRAAQGHSQTFVIKSNPCNPTGVTWSGDALREMVEFCSQPGRAGLIDEAYEFFHEPSPVSALQFVDDINATNLFVSGAATKGLQTPGLRVGWMIGSRQNIEIFRNYSSIGMGGVARPSQLLVAQMLQRDRVTQARNAVAQFYGEQRRRYAQAFEQLGLELFTGDGGFYHWCRLPGTLTAGQLNERLFQHRAAILPGTLCDMQRREDAGPHRNMIRFSFGPLPSETFDENIEILSECLG